MGKSLRGIKGKDAIKKAGLIEETFLKLLT